MFWPAAGETPPSSSSTGSSVKQLREVDGIDTMCVSVLAFCERGIKRPADAAQHTWRESRTRKMSLVGDAARRFAAPEGIGGVARASERGTGGRLGAVEKRLALFDFF